MFIPCFLQVHSLMNLINLYNLGKHAIKLQIFDIKRTLFKGNAMCFSFKNIQSEKPDF